MNILITGSRSAKTFKLLKFFDTASIFLADYGEVPTGSTTYQFITLGDKNEEVTAHNLLNKCLDHSIDLLIPLYRFEVAAVAKANLLFEEFGVQVLLPPLVSLPAFANNTGPTARLMVIKDGAEYPQGAERYNDLSGVFYMDDKGTPVKLFTID